MKKLIKLCYIAMILFAQSLFSGESEIEKLSAQEMQRKAIVKLISENVLLRDKIMRIEERVNILESEKTVVKPIINDVQPPVVTLEVKMPESIEKKEPQEKKNTKVPSDVKKNNASVKFPVYFTPAILSTVRESPTASSRHVITLKSTSRSEITEVACKGKDVGFWGKRDIGWIYISNPMYGSISDENGDKLPTRYDFWCKK